MILITNILEILKKRRTAVLNMKIMVLIIINIWLLVIFWKIIMLNGVNITNNNVILTKMQTWFQPILQILGLDIMNPNILKMLIITIIIVISNLAVLYLSQMLAFIILGMVARYSYKAYNTYVNKDTLQYYGFEKVTELKIQEKQEILNEFIKEKGITDENVIGYLQNKINNINCINKNEVILNLTNNWLEYKQQLISKIVLHQKEQIEQIEMVQKQVKVATWTDSIDYWTLLKIGSGIIIVGAIIIGGYKYFSNDAVKAAKDMSQEALNANNQIADTIAEKTAEQSQQINEHIKNITEELMEQNKKSFQMCNNQIVESSKAIEQKNLQIYQKMQEFQDKIITSQDSINKGILKEQKSFIEEGSQIIEITKTNNENMQELIGGIQVINNNMEIITNNMDELVLKTRELDMVINGGKIAINTIENDVIINKIKEYKPILTEIEDISETVGILKDTVEAMLTYLGLDTLRLTERSLEMLNRIRLANANSENEVVEYRSDNDNPEL